MSISAQTMRYLVARSGGFCQNPNCRASLITIFESGRMSDVNELAHIIGQSSDGPRGQNALPLSQRDEYENIIILCPTCHTKIDKNPQEFPTEMVRGWKRQHEEEIDNALSVPIFKQRPELKKAIEPLLQKNKSIFEAYGPHCHDSANPLSESFKQWQRHVIMTILPNNRRVEALLVKNIDLLNEQEKGVLRQFSVHVEAFEYNHISGEKNSSAPLFSTKLNTILQD